MKPCLLAVFAVVAATMGAQSHDHHSGQHPQPYAGMQSREVKALSPEEIAQLRAGEGMGLAKAAELNHYPGPKHVLDLSDQLSLTGEQRAATIRAFDAMKASAMDLGEKIVDAETRLEAAFEKGTIDDASLIELTAGIADLRGRLRAVHLSAHLAMKRLLTPEQIAEYDRLRGYE